MLEISWGSGGPWGRLINEVLKWMNHIADIIEKEPDLAVRRLRDLYWVGEVASKLNEKGFSDKEAIKKAEELAKEKDLEELKKYMGLLLVLEHVGAVDGVDIGMHLGSGALCSTRRRDLERTTTVRGTSRAAR
ncbi:MAG: hypothetical protein DRJ47_06740 [Thermoprotei archaeon]|nr:MAG: hypothetical protein DRJ47_06740 [Thermoprotei archaeon]